MKRLLQWLREVPGLKSAVLALLVLCLFPLAARADIWGFVDSKGVAHFASERLDERYELFFRGDERFDTSRGVSPVAHTPRAVAVPTAPPKLLAFFEVSPSYKQVKHHLREASNRHGIDYELLQALIATESALTPAPCRPRGRWA
jgi:hypothetical protein